MAEHAPSAKRTARAAVRPFYRSARKAYPRIVRAEGVYLYDSDGRRYLDASSGAAVANIGHGRPEIAEVAARQLREVAYVHGSQFTTHAIEALSERLGAWLPPGAWRFFPTSGGSEATESALKLARQYHLERGRPEKVRFVSRATAYHGASLGALAVSGLGGRRDAFAPLVRDDAFAKVAKPDPHGSAEAQVRELRELLERLGPETVAAFVVEPILGAVDPALAPPDGYYARVRALCDERDVLFIADEVMCGLGRTGRELGLDHWGVTPDVVVLGKGLAAGYAPLGGIAVNEEVHQALAEGSGAFRHGYTYAGHPVSAAVGERVLRIQEEEQLVQHSAEVGATLLEGLRTMAAQVPIVHEVRGFGLFIGVVLGSPTSGEAFAQPGFGYALGDAARARGLNLYPGSGAVDGTRGDHILVAPPLTLRPEEAEELLELFGLALRDVQDEVTRFGE